MSEPSEPTESYDVVARKSLHLVSVLLPLFIAWAPVSVYQPLILVVFLIAIGVETLRNSTEWGYNLFVRLFGTMLKEPERRHIQITGATFLLLSAFLLSYLFSKPIVVTSLLFLSVGDSISGLVGRRWGRHHLIRNKTLEGSLAMLLSCWAIAAFVKEIPIPVKIISGLGATLLEALETPVDDNLLIPLGTGLLLWLFLHGH